MKASLYLGPVVFAMLLAAGCGGKKSGSSPSAAPPAAPPATPADPAPPTTPPTTPPPPAPAPAPPAGNTEQAMAIKFSEGNKVIGTYDPNSTKNQTLQGIGSQAGTRLSLPPGTLGIATDITIDEAPEHANAAFVTGAGLPGETLLTSAGPSAMIVADPAANTAVAFTIELAFSAPPALMDDPQQPVVAFLKNDAVQSTASAGALVGSDTTVKDQKVAVKTDRFGDYEPVYANPPLTSSVSAAYTPPSGDGGDDLGPDQTDGTDTGPHDGLPHGAPIVVTGGYDLGGGMSASNFLRFGDKVIATVSYGPIGSEPFVADTNYQHWTLLKDIAPGPGYSGPNGWTIAGTYAYFFAATPDTGYEMYRTDGTPEGTILLKDINPGTAGSSPGILTSVGPALFFSANDGLHGAELWKTDGTPEGTVLVKDINPGATGSSVLSGTSFDGKFFFAATDGSHGSELWVSDGTDAGTTMAAELTDGATGSFPTALTVGGDGLFLAADHKLFRYTAAGGAVRQTDAGGHAYANFANLKWVDDTLFSMAQLDGSSTNSEPVMTTAGTTTLLKEVEAGTAGSSAAGFTKVSDGVILFFANDGSHGLELWKTDKTPGGTVLVKDININSSTGSDGDKIFVMGGKAYMTVNEGYQNDGNGKQLFVSDGTEAGTHIVKLLVKNKAQPTIFAVDNGSVIFNTGTPIGNGALYKTDGTAAGTLPLFIGGFTQPAAFKDAGDVTVFAASGEGGAELWSVNGTTVATRVKDINPGETGSAPANLESFGGKVYFKAGTPAAGDELWRTDGTEAGTELMHEFWADAEGGNPNSFVATDSALYFVANSQEFGQELYRTDGTTVTLADDTAEGTTGSYPSGLKAWGDKLIYTGGGGTYGAEPWLATPAETKVLKDILPGNPASMPSAYQPFGSNLLFQAKSNEAGMELFITDGTEEGTKLVKDINPGVTSSYPHSILVVGERAVFLADDGTHGVELWVTDGTEAGTMLLKDINEGSPGQAGDSSAMVSFGGKIYLCGLDATHGFELWATDGTPEGTTLVKDIAPGTNSSSPSYFEPANSKLFFTANDGEHGFEIWTSDGTADGTKMISDLTPGPESNFPNVVGPGLAGIYIAYALDGKRIMARWPID